MDITVTSLQRHTAKVHVNEWKVQLKGWQMGQVCKTLKQHIMTQQLYKCAGENIPPVSSGYCNVQDYSIEVTLKENKKNPNMYRN
jgi:hypothetical protein